MGINRKITSAAFAVLFFIPFLATISTARPTRADDAATSHEAIPAAVTPANTGRPPVARVVQSLPQPAKPAITDEAVLSWTKDAVIEALKLDFRSAVQPASFSLKGWLAFVAEQKRAPKSLLQLVNASEPFIRTRGAVDRGYEWGVTFPLQPILPPDPNRTLIVDAAVHYDPTVEPGKNLVITFFARGTHVGRLHPRPAPPMASVNPACGRLPGTPVNAIFKDLERVYFYVQIPIRFQTAIECHGHELRCAMSYGNVDEAARHYRDDYDLYPPLLRPDNLTAMFVKRIEERISPFLQRDNECHTPKVGILTAHSWQQAATERNSLMVTVRLIFDDIDQYRDEPKTAVLMATLYRADAELTGYEIFVLGGGIQTGASIIPLSLSESELSERLNMVLDRSPVSGVPIEENITY